MYPFRYAHIEGCDVGYDIDNYGIEITYLDADEVGGEFTFLERLEDAELYQCSVATLIEIITDRLENWA